MLIKLLCAAIIALSFTIGFFLYKFTKEEFGFLKTKVKFAYGAVFAAILGVIQGFASLAISLILLAAGIIFSSIFFAGKNKSESFRELMVLTLIFFICFIISFYTKILWFDIL